MLLALIAVGFLLLNAIILLFCFRKQIRYALSLLGFTGFLILVTYFAIKELSLEWSLTVEPVVVVMFITTNAEFFLLVVLGALDMSLSTIALQKQKAMHSVAHVGPAPQDNVVSQKISSTTNVPEKPIERAAAVVVEIQPSLRKHGILICAHNSSANLPATIRSFLPHVPCNHIFVADNGSTDEEVLKTAVICAATKVNHIRIEEGGKSRAQLIGSYKMAMLGFTHVTICDDDLIITTWDHQGVLHHFEDVSVKCVSYSVMPADCSRGALAEFQRIEYLLCSYMRKLQSDYTSCFFASGAISTWDISIVIEVLLRHNGEFKGDDMRCGIILMSLSGQKYLSAARVHDAHNRIKMSDQTIYTKVPTCGLHQANCQCGEPSLFKQ